MNRSIKFLSLIVALLTVTSCHIDSDDGIFNCIKGSGTSITKELYLQEFTGLKLEIAADIYITQGDEFSVVATGQENIINELELDVDNGIWDIEFDRCVKNHNELTIYITMPQIDYLAISGSGTIYGENSFDVNELDLNISGSGDIILDVNATQIDASVSGSGKMKLTGAAEKAEYSISGSGDYFTFGLQAKVTTIDISGSGNAEVFVEDYLEVDISGSGDVFYKGNPLLDIRITGSGNVYDAN